MEKHKTKSKLFLIHRLEFYKKQKYWKIFSNEENLENELIKSKNKLNQTYNVEEPEAVASQLNEAFLDTDCEDNIPIPKLPLIITRSKSPKECLHHSDIKPNEEQIYESATSQTWDNKKPLRLETELQHASRDDKCCLSCYYGNLNIANDSRNDLFENNENWPLLPTPSPWPKDIFQSTDTIEGGDSLANLVCAADGLLRTNEPVWPVENYWPYQKPQPGLLACDEWDIASEMSSADSFEFIRGAHAAPHSTEIEMEIPDVLDKADLGDSSLARLSSTQLAAAVKSHALTLRKLMEELSQRQNTRLFHSFGARSPTTPDVSQRAATACSNYMDYPTRDIDPAYLCCKTNTDKLTRDRTFCVSDDIFLAGSHNSGNLKLPGRDRGRIHSFDVMNDRDRVVRIGIESGRPRRL